MICTACKNQLLLGAKFCGQCGTKNQQAQTSAVQSSGMPANALRILSVEAADPDSDGDMSVEVKFSVTNKSGSGWDQLTTRIQIISESGCIEETPSSHEEFIGDGETEEFSVNFYGVKAKPRKRRRSSMSWHAGQQQQSLQKLKCLQHPLLWSSLSPCKLMTPYK